MLRILLSLFTLTVFASDMSYTVEDVASHSTPGDCWMIFEDRVYDFSQYVPDHDKFMDIREWCGRDMTQDFKDKAGLGRDHREGTYQLLERYEIGSLVDSTVEITESVNPYNLILPLVLTTLLYWGSYFVFKKKLKGFNAFWNTVLLLTFVIPSFGFGVYMMLRYSFPSLWDIEFDFMYWHVELSVVMGVIAISHFIQRFKLYLVQLKK